MTNLQLFVQTAMAVLASVVTATPQFAGGGFAPGNNGSSYPGAPGSSPGSFPGSSPGSGSGSGSGNGSGSSGSGSSSGFSSGNGSDPQDSIRFDIEEATRVRIIHGILGAVAMVILFPCGSVFIRILPSRAAFYAHALTQMMALGVLIACAGLGIHLVLDVQQIGKYLLNDPDTNYHPLIGLVVLGCLTLQPAIGFIHHLKYKVTGRRQVWTYTHLFNGRVVITLGMINGGLGLYMAGASSHIKTAYIAAAASVWAVWMGVAAWHEWHRGNPSRLLAFLRKQTSRPF